LWEFSSTALATASHLTALANFQLAEARRATLEVVELLGHATATETVEVLQGVVLETPESKEFIDSLLEIVHSPEFAQEVKQSDMIGGGAMEQVFGGWGGLPTADSSSESQSESEEEGHMEVDLNSPPRETIPPQPVPSSSRIRLPALMPAASVHSLCSQASFQAGSAAASSSSNVDSLASGVSKGSKKRSKPSSFPFFSHFNLH
jgi:hypothetical protein